MWELLLGVKKMTDTSEGSTLEPKLAVLATNTQEAL